ncbi:hypothetical protein GGS23DRAFT_38691 [Durotheca rogersii]|uniref:uncharacterized protein n=1 Tax=Durotheca rogersii TaxID=419775 RepID=UPI002220C7F9|nr:uncharacterized protein GGS23DRAFT_38691 [Durotheca rogersii]KAI5868595.1 hypothetical protein GGS23DRAFT_38691 [Durotheca rogersii]
MAQRRDTYLSHDTASSRDTRRSSDSYDSRSTAPTSLDDSPPPSIKGSDSRPIQFRSPCYDEDLSPVTSLYPRSSVETYSSQASSDESEDADSEGSLDYSDIPPLPVYRHEIEEINVRPSTPDEFAALFPSMNRLNVRHDDFTPDGNMNLRVDTVVLGKRRKTIQLFHLRMYDLNKREFSLRRYCRDSGREVCGSKRKYVEPAIPRRPKLQRSMSNAMRTFTRRPTLSRSPTAAPVFTSKGRPSTSDSSVTHSVEADDDFTDVLSQSLSGDKKEKSRPVATNTIKLEFSNYARVDVKRRGNKNNKRYEFEWWGHKYSWKRVSDKHTESVAFHLLRDGQSTPVAHIVPEIRSPTQADADERAGGWVPPCHMWLSDQSLVDAATDVADIVIATGLIALVDNCIKERWQTKAKAKKPRRISLPLPTKPIDVELMNPKSFVQNLFSRRNSDHQPRPPHKVVAAC